MRAKREEIKMRYSKMMPALIAAAVMLLSGCSLSGDSSSGREDGGTGSSKAVSGKIEVPDINSMKEESEVFDVGDFRITMPKDMTAGDDEAVKQVFGDMKDVQDLGLSVLSGSYRNEDMVFVHAVIDYDGILAAEDMIGAEYSAVEDAVASLMARATVVVTDYGPGYIEFEDEPEGGEAMHYRVAFAVSGTKLYHFAFGTKIDDWDKFADQINNYIGSIVLGESS